MDPVGAIIISIYIIVSWFLTGWGKSVIKSVNFVVICFFISICIIVSWLLTSCGKSGKISPGIWCDSALLSG